MFEDLRHAFRDLLHGGLPAEERRSLMHAMKDSLVHARVARDELVEAVAKTRRRAEAERAELETTRRRKGLAEGIGDGETVKIAARFEQQQAERLAITERKLENQEAELALLERELEEMTQQLRAASAGVGSGLREGAAAAAVGEDDLSGAHDTALNSELDSLRRSARRATADADAEARLAELKKRMGR